MPLVSWCVELRPGPTYTDLYRSPAGREPSLPEWGRLAANAVMHTPDIYCLKARAETHVHPWRLPFTCGCRPCLNGAYGSHSLCCQSYPAIPVSKIGFMVVMNAKQLTGGDRRCAFVLMSYALGRLYRPGVPSGGPSGMGRGGKDTRGSHPFLSAL